jgi:hypothetical protein
MFMASSELYQEGLDPSDYYNDSSAINNVTNRPYGFEYFQAPDDAGGVKASGYHLFLDVNAHQESRFKG